MKILGISAFYHDSAASLIVDGKIINAVQEERFTRKKHDPSFPVNSIKFCLENSGYSFSDLNAIAFYDKPLLKFERLIETYYRYAPKGLSSFLKAMPVWIKEKMFLKKILKDELSKIGAVSMKEIEFLFPEHHLSHAASAYFVSGFNNAAILTIDGVGEWATASICHGTENKIKILNELKFPHSVGLLYSSFTYFLGFRVNSGEYKLMGLAPYGNPSSTRVKDFIDKVKTEIVKINDDGSIFLHMKYFKYPYGLRMINQKKWEELFGVSLRKPETELCQEHCDLAYAIQFVTEEIVLKMAKEASRITGANKLCMAGGVALNCVANGKLLEKDYYEDIFIQPAAGDAGGAIGAALAAYHIYYEKPLNGKSGQNSSLIKDNMNGALLGPEFNDVDVERLINKYNAKYKRFSNQKLLCDEVAELIHKGKIVGWFQGKMEFGPRALGNRSIIADPGNPEMQKKLNLSIKYRESFRPFAPAVLYEDASDFFDLEKPSPYMLLVKEVNKKIRRNIPENYHSLSTREKLYVNRSSLPSITHIDFSARIQTIHREINPLFWQLLHSFKKLAGYGVLINTSFNVRGEPIVCDPENAYVCFMRTEMDYLVIGNYLFNKNDQEKLINDISWEKEYVLD